MLPKHGLRSFLTLCMLLSLSFPGQGQQTEENLYSFTIETAITQQEVTTASKASERIEEAPGIVTVLTREQIEQYGGLSLYHLLDRLTSTYMLGTALHPNNVLSLRGDNSAHYTQKVLILFNGRPVRESLAGGIMMAVFNAFPVERIERLEVVRGPGSVLYGTGAYHGVINIITREEQPLSTYFTYGGYGRVQTGTSLARALPEGYIGGGINVFDETGWDFTTTAQNAPENAAGEIIRTPENTQTIRMGLRGIGAELSAGYKNFSAQFYLGHSQQDAMFFVGSWVPKQLISGTDTTDSYIRFRSKSTWGYGDIGYTLAPSENWRFETHLTYNFHRLLETDRPANDDRARSYSADWLLETTHYLTFSPRLNLTVGGLVNFQNGQQLLPERQNADNTLGYVPYNIYNLNQESNPDPFAITPRYRDPFYSFYTQLSYQPAEELRLILGGQLNKASRIPLDIVPRVALIYNYSPLWGGKLLFGQAFRSAAAAERLIDFFPIILGNPDLEPEKVTTFEAQVFHNSLSRQFRSSLTFFYSLQRNLISIAPDQEYFLSGVYANTGKRSMTGLEAELFWQVSKRWSGTFSATYQQNSQEFELAAITEEEDNRQLEVNNITGMPEFMAKTGIHYELSTMADFGLFYSFFSGNDFAPVRYLDENGGEQTLFARRRVNPPLHPVHWISLQARYRLENILGGNLELIFFGDNLLGEEVHMPEYTVQAVNSLPARGGRMVYGTLRYTF